MLKVQHVYREQKQQTYSSQCINLRYFTLTNDNFKARFKRFLFFPHFKAFNVLIFSDVFYIRRMHKYYY